MLSDEKRISHQIVFDAIIAELVKEFDLGVYRKFGDVYWAIQHELGEWDWEVTGVDVDERAVAMKRILRIACLAVTALEFNSKEHDLIFKGIASNKGVDPNREVSYPNNSDGVIRNEDLVNSVEDDWDDLGESK